MKENTPFENAVDLLDADHKAVKSMFIESEWRSWMTFHPIPTSLLRPGRACDFFCHEIHRTCPTEPAGPNRRSHAACAAAQTLAEMSSQDHSDQTGLLDSLRVNS